MTLVNCNWSEQASCSFGLGLHDIPNYDALTIGHLRLFNPENEFHAFASQQLLEDKINHIFFPVETDKVATKSSGSSDTPARDGGMQAGHVIFVTFGDVPRPGLPGRVISTLNDLPLHSPVPSQQPTKWPR